MRAFVVCGLLCCLSFGCGPEFLGNSGNSGNGSSGGSGGDGDGDGDSGEAAQKEACEAFCDRQENCDAEPMTSLEDCITLCKFQLATAVGNGQDECAATLEVGLACVGELTCPEYEEWKGGAKGDEYPCSAETAEADDVCQQ